MPIYDEDYWMEQEHRRQWEERMAENHRQEQEWFESMFGQYFKENQQKEEDMRKYPLFFWRELCDRK